jgi:hypothetical protein
MPAVIRLAVRVGYLQTLATRALALEKTMDLLAFLKSMAVLAFVAAGGLTIVLWVLAALAVTGGALIVWACQRRSMPRGKDVTPP